MHEYKRQLLGVLKILYLYGRIKDDPNCEIPPVTFIFGGKAAPGYRMAKTVIRLIWSVGEEIGRDKGVRDRLKVLFAEDYNVTSAEAIIPAADISEQISLAGKEASGTGCMKMMMNGAVTIGTLDGANVEIKNAVGDENFYVFGMNDGEVEDLWNGGYESVKYYLKSEKIRRAASFLEGEIAGRRFDGVLNYLLYSHGVPDPYMCLADFDSYTAEWERMILDTQNRTGWQRKSTINIAKSGYFSSDRSIGEYAEKIWKIKPIV
jgi:starch phosphorylase